MSDLDAYCSVLDACGIAGVSDGYMRRLLRSGRIEGRKVGNTYLVLRSSLASYQRTPGMGRPSGAPPAREPGRGKAAARKRRRPRRK